MSKKKLTSLIFVILLLVVACILPISRKEKLRSNIEYLITSYKAGKAQYIEIASIQYFSWDKVYRFGGYSSCDDIAAVIGVSDSWFGCEYSGIETTEGATLFVFMKNELVVTEAFYYGTDPLYNSDGYLPEQAYFILDEKGRIAFPGNK